MSNFGPPQELERSKSLLYKPFLVAVPLVILFLGWLIFTMMKHEDVAVVKDQDENKLISLCRNIYYYFREDARPKPAEEEAKYNYIQRLWKYLN